MVEMMAGRRTPIQTYALKAANDEVQEKFLECLSPTERKAVEDGMRELTISLREVLEAQTTILIAATELLENGEIVIDRRGNEEIVYL